MTITPDNADTLIQALQWLKEDGEIELRQGNAVSWSKTPDLTGSLLCNATAFRRVPKPEECWCVIYNEPDKRRLYFYDRIEAEKCAERHRHSLVRVVHMLEVKP